MRKSSNILLKVYYILHLWLECLDISCCDARFLAFLETKEGKHLLAATVPLSHRMKGKTTSRRLKNDARRFFQVTTNEA